METYTYKTNLPACRRIETFRPIQVGEVIDFGEDRSFAVVLAKVSGTLTLKPVSFIGCKIVESDRETQEDQS